jgi:hypothetical protein
MATTTPNFGWSVPTSTDLVKDGATAIETLGDAIDASLVDLKGGTTGQALTKNSATDMDFVWATPAAGGMTSIASGSLSGAGVTLSSISSSYKDLVLIVRDWYPSVNNRQTAIQFNSDTGSNYFSEAGALLSEIRTGTNQAASNGNAFSSFYIYDYADATHAKSVVTVSNSVTSTPENNVALQTGYWTNSNAITSITLKLNADNFSGGTYILYGVK